ncbi:MAG: methyltransferase domain-containing protein [Acidobacteriota bacterium]
MSPNVRRTGDAISIPGDYQLRAARSANRVQRFWHATKTIVVDQMLPPAPGDFVIDAGCGSGVVAEYLASSGAQVMGVDANPEAIGFATSEFSRPNLRFVRGLVDDELTLDRPVDKFYSLEVIEHVYRPQGVAMLRSFHRLLRPGGRALITTPNYRSYWPLLEWTLDTLRLAPKMSGEQHVEHYHRRKLRAAAEEAGFSNSTIRTICLVSPWLAPLSWPLATRAARGELRIPLPLGCILVAVLTKNLS